MKFKAIIAAAMLTLIMCTSAFASTTFETRGSAIATGIIAISSSTSYQIKPTMLLSNISGVDVECRVTVFDQDGNNVSSINDVYSGNSSGTNAVLVSTGAAAFTIPAGATRNINMWDSNMNKQIIGHALIEWSSADGNVRKALIGGGRVITTNGGYSSYSTTFSVNGGMPF